jgi:hypothetical protein
MPNDYFVKYNPDFKEVIVCVDTDTDCTETKPTPAPFDGSAEIARKAAADAAAAASAAATAAAAAAAAAAAKAESDKVELENESLETSASDRPKCKFQIGDTVRVQMADKKWLNRDANVIKLHKCDGNNTQNRYKVSFEDNGEIYRFGEAQLVKNAIGLKRLHGETLIKNTNGTKDPNGKCLASVHEFLKNLPEENYLKPTKYQIMTFVNDPKNEINLSETLDCLKYFKVIIPEEISKANDTSNTKGNFPPTTHCNAIVRNWLDNYVKDKTKITDDEVKYIIGRGINLIELNNCIDYFNKNKSENITIPSKSNTVYKDYKPLDKTAKPEEDLLKGGNSSYYYEKYMKYKAKYLQLQRNN